MQDTAKRTSHHGAHAPARDDAPRAATRPWFMAALAILLSAAACGAPEDEASSAGGPAPAGNTPLGLTPATTAAGKYRVWPDGRIPYRIDDSVGETTRTRLLPP